MLIRMGDFKMGSKQIWLFEHGPAFRTMIYLLRYTMSLFHMVLLYFPSAKPIAADRTQVLATLSRIFVMFLLILRRI